ncbi:MAG: long-chain-fatty-acid--CoA ligase [Chloroflexota bacterium]
MSLNLSLLVEASARTYPDRRAIIFNELEYSYAQLNVMANKFANVLHSLGVKRGDKVALMMPNMPAFTIAYYGILKLGATVVPLNVLFKAPEVAYHLEDSDSVAMVVYEGFLEEAAKGFDEAHETCHNLIVFAPQSNVPGGALDFQALLREAPSTFDTAQTMPDDTAVILYTSGTTGRPKGAELTHFNMFYNAAFAADRLMSATPDDVVMVALPLFHSFGQTCCQNLTLYAGATMTMLPRFTPEAALSLFQRDRVTVFAGVPTMYWYLLNFPEADRFNLAQIAADLRLCVSGAAALPVELMKGFEEKYDVTILEGYGLSETSPVASFNVRERPRKPGSIGLPIWGVEIKILDDDDNELPPGPQNVGEIVIRGHNVMKGYYKRPEATAEAMRGDWFHTGDLAYMDEDGYFFIVDRKKDMIIRGGLNVYPREVEEVLQAHPAVSLCAVVGVADVALGEEVKAFVVAHPNYADRLASETEQLKLAKEIVAYCKERMAAYKYPRQVEFRDTLPMTATGKVLKTELRNG